MKNRSREEEEKKEKDKDEGEMMINASAKNPFPYNSNNNVKTITTIIMFILFLFTTCLYCHDDDNLNGDWILDDKGTVTKNPLVMNTVTKNTNETMWTSSIWIDIWYKDFWGRDSLMDDRSHKSWRPLTTVTYRLNRLLLLRMGESSSPSSFMNYDEDNDGDSMDSYWFHLVDRMLHAIVTALALPVTAFNFLHHCRPSPIISSKTHSNHLKKQLPTWQSSNNYKWQWWLIFGTTLTSLLFALHPIHVEAVANTTGRAEVLCTMFYFLGFLWYAIIGTGVSFKLTRDTTNSTTSIKSIVGVLGVSFFTFISMLCKEHGVTLPLVCVIWDFYIASNTSLHEIYSILFVKNQNKMNSEQAQLQPQSSRGRVQCIILFLYRTITLSLFVIPTLCLWRLSKNNNSSPNFVCEQNPTACVNDAFVRFVSFTYVWAFNFWLLLIPDKLCPDWSGESITLLDQPSTDPRFTAVFLTWISLLLFLYHAITAAIYYNHPPFVLYNNSDIPNEVEVQNDDSGDNNKQPINYYNYYSNEFHLWRRTAITSFCWMLIPFLMSSNLFVHVGFVVADRTLYLPSFGFCLLLVQYLVYLSFGCSIYIHPTEDKKERNAVLLTITKRQPLPLLTQDKIIVLGLASVILILYAMKQQAQTQRWSDPVLLWGEAYRINPNSCITGKEYGMSLVNAQRPKDAVPVLKDSHQVELNSKEWFVKTIQDVQLARQGKYHPTKEEVTIAKMTRMSSMLQTRFKLVTAMGNSGSCDQAVPLIEEGLKWAEEILVEIEKEMQKKGQSGGQGKEYDDFITGSKNETSLSKKHYSFKEIESVMLDNKAYLYVAKSRCAENVAIMASSAYEALVTKNMDYTMHHAQSVNDVVGKIQEQGIDPRTVLLTWKKNADGQTAKVDFTVWQ